MPALLAASAALQVFVHTAGVNDLLWQEGRLWAATSGGVEVWAPEGERLALLPTGLPRAEATAIGAVEGLGVVVGTASGAARLDASSGAFVPLPYAEGRSIVAVLPEGVVTREGWLLSPAGLAVDLRPPGGPTTVTDAASLDGHVVLGTMAGEVVLFGERLIVRRVPGPVSDLSASDDHPGRVRVAWTTGAGEVSLDGSLTEASGAAVGGAGPLWGTADGRLLDEEGLVARLPAPVRASLRIEEADAIAVATEDGLYWLEGADLRRLTPEGQLCGGFITGMARWQGRLVVSTFDRGACQQAAEGTWRRLEGLPSEMLNGVLVDGDALLLASSEGLVRVEADGTTSIIGQAADDAARYAPGLHHPSVTGLARGGDRLWITDLAGPISVDGQGRWRRHRYQVWSTSNQRVAACGRQAWVATEDAGASWFDGARWQHFDALTGLPDDWIMAVACRAEGRGYVGTYQDGVWRQAGDGARWEELAGIPDAWILSLATRPVAEEDDEVWAGTMGGLYRWSEQGGSWSAPVEGLPDPRVHSLFLEEDGLWIGTENGLAFLPLPAQTSPPEVLSLDVP